MRGDEEGGGVGTRGSDSTDRETEQEESWSSDNRAGSVTRLPQTHRKSSFPVGLSMRRAATT